MKTDWLTPNEVLDALHAGHKVRHASMTKIEYVQYADESYICMPIAGEPVVIGALELANIMSHYPSAEWLVLGKPPALGRCLTSRRGLRV